MAKLGESLKFKYEPILEQAPLDMKFHYFQENEDGTQELKIRSENFKLITDIEELRGYIDKCKGKTIGFDTETTGLTYVKDKIVGFSISLDSYSGIYVPIRHQNRLAHKKKVTKRDKNGFIVYTKLGRESITTETTYTYSECEDNLDPKDALNILYEILIGAQLVLMHNSEFDLNMLKFEGYDVTKIKSFDNLILPYLFDPEATGLAGLKALEKRVLGREVPEFKDVLGKEYDTFAFVPPKDGYVYACHDKETDVLTENGWVKWPEYNGMDKLATVNLNTGMLEYQSPTKVYKYIYNGKMECCKSQSIDYCVTPNHNMIVGKSQTKGPWIFKKAEDLNVEEVALTAPDFIQGTDEDIIINNNSYNRKNLVQIAALVLADGYCRKDINKHEVHISVSSEKNYDEITKILKESSFEWKEYRATSSKKITDFCCYNKDLHGWIYEYAGHGSINKRVPLEVFKSSKAIILAFLRAYAITDGHQYDSGACRYYTISNQMVDNIQELLLYVGKRSSVYKKEPVDREINGRKVKKENCHTLYTINTTSDRTTRYKKRNRFQIDYNDYVYCAEVPNHTLVTRRNGSTLISGNCCDTSGLIGVFDVLFPKVKELLNKFKTPLSFDGKVYNVLNKDNQMVKAFVDYYGHAKILVDRERAKQYKLQLEQQRKEIVEEIYAYFGQGVFNLSTSSNEFKEVMASKNLFTGVKTDKGGDSWGKKAAGEMKRNLNKIKEAMNNWKTISFSDGVLSKSGNGFQLAQMLEIYGTHHFKMKSTIKNVTFKGIYGEPVDVKYFWITVKQIYKEEMEKLRILSLIQKNNSVNKSLNSYVDKLTQVDECYMRYRLKGTKSGRLSSGNGSKSDKKRNFYYIDLNAQNLTKPASAYYSATKCDEKDPEGILGWKFQPLATDYAMEHLEDLYIVEGQDPGITIRSCLKAPKGRYVVSLDYDAQEYKLMAILSQDSKMLDNFAKGIDPHTASAYAIWGEENYNKAKRKKAKIFNFLNNYSGGAHTLSQQLDIPVKEAEEMIEKYNQTFWEMVQWKEKEIAKMHQNGSVVFTAFGRPRQFKGWMEAIEKNKSEGYTNLLDKDKILKDSNRVLAAVERRVSSHMIQGTAGDILRLVLLKLYKRYFRNRNPHIDFLSTVHDEINYTIDKEVAVEYIKELEQIMTFDTLDPSLPITTSTDIGYTYGNMFPFVWENEKKLKLIPKRVHHA